MILTTYDSKNQIISSKYSGNISLDEISDHFHQLGRTINLPDYLYYYEDHTEAKYTFKAGDVKKIVRLLNICIKRFECIKVAIIQSKPRETAYSILALQYLDFTNINASVFSTTEAANNWLKTELASSDESVIKELKDK